MTNILSILGNFVYIQKNKLIFIWIILIILSILTLVFSEKKNSESDLSGLEYTEANKVTNILKNDFNLRLGTSFGVVIIPKTDTKALEDILQKKFPDIKKITDINSRKLHKNKLLYIDFDKDKEFVKVYKLSSSIREVLKSWANSKNVKAMLTGNPAFQNDAYNAGKKESSKSEIFALIFSLLILIYTFGALISAIIPLIIGITTIIYLNASVNLLGFETNTLSQILTGLIGLALAIDYSLFIISRYREEKVKNDIGNSIKKVFMYPMKTIMVSSIIMLWSISVLFIPDVSTSRAVVINLFLVISISLLNSIFILPPLLMISDKLLDKPKFINKIIKKTDSYNFWKAFSNHITDYPKSYFILSCLILLTLSLPLTKINLIESVYTLTPENTESMKAYKILEEDNWGGELIPTNVIIKSKGSAYEPKFISYVYDFTKYLEKNKDIESVASITSFGNQDMTKEQYISLLGSVYNLGVFSQNSNIIPLINSQTGNNLTLVNVFSKDMTDISKIHQLINQIKQYAKDNPEYELLTGGVIARATDFTEELYGYIPLMITIIFVGIYIILLFYMKSIILPLKAGIMNFLPIISSFGILTLVFQFGYLKDFLATGNINGVINMVPIILFCIIFGLSMDYEVLILSRITESYNKTKNVKLAITEGMAKSGSVITGAALILLAVFLPGIFSSSPPSKQICIGISSAILIDATIVRLLLVPSFMMLMGKYNWIFYTKSSK